MIALNQPRIQSNGKWVIQESDKVYPITKQMESGLSRNLKCSISQPNNSRVNLWAHVNPHVCLYRISLVHFLFFFLSVPSKMVVDYIIYKT